MEKRIERAEEEPNQEQAEDDQPREKDDPILDLAIEYVVNSAYPTGISKEKKRAVRKRAAKLLVEDGDVFLRKKNRKVTENKDRYHIYAYRYCIHTQYSTACR